MAASSSRVCSDSHLGVSGHPRLNPPGSGRSQSRAPVLVPELGAPSPSSVPGRAGPATGARPPCCPAACPAVTCSGGRRGLHRARAGASRARPTFAWSLQKLTAPSRARGASLLKPWRSPVPTSCATPARAPLCVSTSFWSLPLAVRRAPPARPRLSGQPERRPPRTGVRRAAPPGLGPRGPGSS